MSDDPPADAAAADTAEPGTEPVERDEERESLLSRFVEAMDGAVVDSHIEVGTDLTVMVRSDAWLPAARVAREKLGCRYFTFLSVIDWMPSPFGRSMDSSVDTVLAARAEQPPADASEDPPAPMLHGTTGGDTRFQVFARVAHVGVPGAFWGMTIKADVPDGTLTVESWVTVFAGADWHEREAWEMYGITFAGHPGLRHMYLPGDFEGNPGRKDFPLLARLVKPWPGIVDVEPMPTDEPADEPADVPAGSGRADDAPGGSDGEGGPA